MSTRSTGSSRDPGLPAKPLTVTIPHARQLLGLGTTTIWKLIGEDRLKTLKIGKRRLILFSSIEELIAKASAE